MRRPGGDARKTFQRRNILHLWFGGWTCIYRVGLSPVMGYMGWSSACGRFSVLGIVSRLHNQ
jgi:hypothetical protein